MAQRIAPVLVVPVRKPDMRSQLHPGPFAVPECLYLRCQRFVAQDAALHQISHFVCNGFSLLCIQVVPPGIQMHFQQIDRSRCRKINHALVCLLHATFPECCPQLFIFLLNGITQLHHPSAFVIVRRMIDFRMQGFRAAQAVYL